MQITYLNYFLAAIVAYLGLLLGIILIKIAPEEQKPGKKYFIFLKKAIFLLVLIFYLFFYNFNPAFSLILLVFTLILMLNKKLKLEKIGLTYFFFGLVFYLSSRVFNLFILETNKITENLKRKFLRKRLQEKQSLKDLKLQFLKKLNYQ